MKKRTPAKNILQDIGEEPVELLNKREYFTCRILCALVEPGNPITGLTLSRAVMAADNLIKHLHMGDHEKYMEGSRRLLAAVERSN